MLELVLQGPQGPTMVQLLECLRSLPELAQLTLGGGPRDVIEIADEHPETISPVYLHQVAVLELEFPIYIGQLTLVGTL